MADGVDAQVLAKTRSFHTMDALRGVGAASVVMFHASFLYGIKLSDGQSAVVDFFFVMSGFIIAYRYDADLRMGLGLRRFLKLRVIRLYPLYLLGTVFGLVPALVALWVGVGAPIYRGLAESFPLAVLMLPSHYAEPGTDEIYPLNYAAWSLALDVIVNVAYAASFRFWTTRRICLLLAVALGSLAFCAWLFGGLAGGYAWTNAPVGIVRVIYGFAIGVLLCRVYREKPFTSRLPWWLVIGLTLTVFFYEPPCGHVLYQVAAVAIFAPFLIAAAVASEPPPKSQKICAMVGVYSYVVYSLHIPLIGFFLRGEERLHVKVAAQSWTQALAFTVLLAVTCVIADTFYDRPLRRFLSKHWARREQDRKAPLQMSGCAG